MIQEYGLKAYSEGLQVYTTIDSNFQNQASRALMSGLEEYDRRHGFRKPDNITQIFPEDFFQLPRGTKIDQIEIALSLESDNYSYNEQNLAEVFRFLNKYSENKNRIVGVVSDLEKDLEVLVKSGELIIIKWTEDLNWARPYISENRRGPRPRSYADILEVGDIIWLKKDSITKQYSLTQIPDVQSALISVDPQSGSILALVGGYDFYLSKFNRAEQASPLLGSNFKPFLYAAAFSNGFNPSSIINDAPIIFEDEVLEEKWRPRNASGKFFGLTRLREGLLQSRNLVSVRLLRELGVNKVRSYAEKFGFDKDRLPSDLSLSLGTASLDPLSNAIAYSVFANGGKKVEPFVINKILDRSGSIIFERNPKEHKEVIDPRVAFLINDILKEAASRGTARRVSELKRKDFAGKTGTTNRAESTWFTGYNEHIVTSVWVGFDQPRSLGDREFGSSIALPIWLDYKKQIIDEIPISIELPPQGISSVKIDKDNGELAKRDSKNLMFEYFLEENIPN